MNNKILEPSQTPSDRSASNRFHWSRYVAVFGSILLLLSFPALKNLRLFQIVDGNILFPWNSKNYEVSEYHQRVPQTHHLQWTLSTRWSNPDGGFWRPMFVINGVSPPPPIEVHEDDLLYINIHNNLGIQTTIHWVGINHHGKFWNDGSGGVTQYPIFPRANWTTLLNTTDNWGVKWFLDHVSTPSVDGNYGLIWIKPRSSRPRPYSMISKDPAEIQAMLDAESNPSHVTVYAHQHRPMDWLLLQLQAEGYDPYCFKSVLLNGKGRVHCKPEELTQIDGKAVDDNGCVAQAAVAYPDCTPSLGDYEVIETGTGKWKMINFVNTGLEHPWRISIDGHKMWVVANDGGFVTPQEVDTITITDAEAITVMVRLDAEPGEYAIRVHALSLLQQLQGYGILRYPGNWNRKLGEAMPRPAESDSAINPDGSPKCGTILLNKSLLHPYPPKQPPQTADRTLRFKATGAPSKWNPYVTECSLNKKPWQIFRGSLEPLMLRGDPATLGDPIVTDLPLGSVVDIILTNDLNVSIPMYKHNDPTFLLGSQEAAAFEWESVEEARKARPDLFNLENPELGFLHDLPALGWMAVRWRVEKPSMSMFHAFRVRYFVLGMQVPLFEGYESFPEIPEKAWDQPHIDFEMPEHMGIFD